MIAALLSFAAGALGAAGAAGLVASLRRPVVPGPRSPALLRAVARLGRRLPARARPAERLTAAGLGGVIGAREFAAAKAGAAVAGASAGVLLAASAPGRLGVLLVMACPAGGFLLPDLWLARRSRARAAAARREAPALIDLLRVTVDAGISPARALGAVGTRSSGPLGREWRAVAREVEMGVPFDAALAGMARRMPLPEVEALAGALARSARHGAPLGDALAAQARDARMAERRRIQEHAARAAPKIQLVVALLLVPSVLLLVAAALAGALLGPGGAVPAR
ncbi:MAG TPA: type II secretion system F family protein [Thermoleophilaceae bacterium]|nr:type II secretion system F family protein [Thermoleophilaceae bacterium]